MASSNSNQTGDIKDSGRQGRLSFSKFSEHQLRNEFKADAIKKCDIQVHAFADCAKDEGIFVVFRCRDFQSAVNECMSIYNSTERWEQYKKDHAADLENKIV